MLLLCELHDQDRRLACDSEKKHEADLRIDIVFDIQEIQGQHRTEKRHGNRQQNRERNHPAFILRHKEQIDEQQRQCKHNHDLIAGKFLLIRHIRPFKRHAGIDLLHDLFHLVHRLSRAVAGSGGTVDKHRLEHIVARQELRYEVILDIDQRSQRHHIAFAVADIRFGQVADIVAEHVVALKFNLVGLAVFVEIIHISGTEDPLQSSVDAVRRHAEPDRLFTVDVEIHLRERGAERRIDAGEDRRIVRLHENLVQRLLKILRSHVAGGVLEHQGKTARGSESGNRRHAERDDRRIRNLQCFRVEFCNDRILLFLFVLALGPVFQRHNAECAVGGIDPVQDIEAGSEDEILHFGNPAQYPCHFLRHFLRTHQRSAVGKLDAHEKRPLILVRNESGRQERIELKSSRAHDRIKQKHKNGFPQERFHNGGIPARQLVESGIEPAEEEKFSPVRVNRFQKQRAECGAECQCVDH